MINRLVILSDIHSNLSALNAVIEDIEHRKYILDGIILLGDNINYGMRPNEVIERLRDWSKDFHILANIYGNHEKALFDKDTTHFSTERGRQILEYTRLHLTDDSKNYLTTLEPLGYIVISINGKRILVIHGDINDPYWGKLKGDTINNVRYAEFDYVISGHTHIPHLIEHFFPSGNTEFRNKKRTIFLNPGSVGQPRNHNNRAQYIYAEIDCETFHFNSVAYNVVAEQRLYPNEVDTFYKNRLQIGI